MFPLWVNGRKFTITNFQMSSSTPLVLARGLKIYSISLPGKQYRILRKGKAVVRA